MNDSRKWALPLFLGVLACSLMLAWVTATIGQLEASWASHTRHGVMLPGIATMYLAHYSFGWFLPLATALATVMVAVRKNPAAWIISSWISILLVIHVTWILFALVASYLINHQIMIGDSVQ